MNKHGLDNRRAGQSASSEHCIQGGLAGALQRCISRNCIEALELLDVAIQQMSCRQQCPAIPFDTLGEALIRTEHAQTYGRMIYIPRVQGTAYVISDIEGHLPEVIKIFQRHSLIERLLRNHPNDQVHFICLGDVVDRGTSASSILEFLLELKFQSGFEDHIHLLSGTHELSETLQKHPHQGGFFKEVDSLRSSYNNAGDLSSETYKRMCELDPALKDLDPQISPSLALRRCLWRRFNALFQVLPTTIVTANGLVLTHAGPTQTGCFECVANPSLPRPSFKEAIQWLAGFPAPGESFSAQHQKDLAHSIEQQTWSDFNADIDLTAANEKRKCGLYFGLQALGTYLECLHTNVMIRGHQNCGETISNNSVWTAGDKLLTCRTSPSFCTYKLDESSETVELQVKGAYAEISLWKDISTVGDVTIHCLGESTSSENL
jgi:hypothetical protein